MQPPERNSNSPAGLALLIAFIAWSAFVMFLYVSQFDAILNAVSRRFPW